MKIQWNKVTWYSTGMAVLLGVVIFAAGIYIGIMYQKGASALEWSEQMRIDRPDIRQEVTVYKAEKQYEFVQTGNIKNNATGEVELDDWILVYEKAGAPALTVGIIFTTDSRCVTGRLTEHCNTAKFEQGQRVTIMGHANTEGNIIVERLEVL